MKISNPLQLTTVLLTLTCILLPLATYAASFSAVEVEQNAAGTTVPALTFANGANEITTSFDPVEFAGGGSAVVATLRMIMSVMPNAGASMILGDCDVDFVPAASPLETDCSDNAASIPRISRDNVIAGIIALTNVTQDGTPLVVFSDPIDGSDFVVASDTTGDVDTVVGPIKFEEHTDFSQLYFLTAGNSDGELSTASATLTIPDALPANASDHSIEIDGLGSIDLGLTAKTETALAQHIKEGIVDSPGYGSKDYTVDFDGNTVLFTSKTPGNAGNGSLTINDGTYTKTNPVAANTTHTVTGALVANADDQSLTIGGLTIGLGNSALTASQVSTQIYNAFTSHGGYGALNFTLAVNAPALTFAKKATGPGGNGALSITDGAYGLNAQVVTFTPTDLASGNEYVFTITINGTSYTYSTNETSAQSIVEGLQPLVDGNAAVVCEEDNIKITCTAASAGTSFTYSASVDSTEIVVEEDRSTRRSSNPSARIEALNNSTSFSSNETTQTIARIQEQIAVLLDLVKKQAEIENKGRYFTRNLQFGSAGEDVKRLQQFLNSNNFLISTSGPGSPGKETSYFGMLTKNAVGKFQTENRITPTGIFGPKTRTKINSLLNL